MTRGQLAANVASTVLVAAALVAGDVLRYRRHARRTALAASLTASEGRTADTVEEVPDAAPAMGA